MAIWLAAAALLQKRGNARVIYWLLKLVLWGYTMPLVYMILYGRSHFSISEGWFLVTTPAVKWALYVGFTLWLVGVVVYGVIQIPMVLEFRRVRRNRIYATVEMTRVMDRLREELGIRKNIALYQGYMVISPFICGFRRIEIYLPVENLSKRALEIVLRHELIHHKQRDTFWKPVFAIVTGLFWFNPLVWFVSRKMQRCAEASCDETCCRNGLTAKEYFGTIIDMVTSEAYRAGAYSPLWAEGENELMWRIHCMKRNQQNRRNKSLIAMAAAAMMMIGSCMSVYAATMGVSGLYNDLYRGTQEKAQETLVDEAIIEHTGTVDELFAGLTIEETLGARVTSMDWTVKSMVVKKSPDFYKKADGKIYVSGIVKPENITVQVGIIEPDDHVRYIDAKNAYAHTFKLTKKGYYKVFVENLTKTTITIEGQYD